MKALREILAETPRDERDVFFYTTIGLLVLCVPILAPYLLIAAIGRAVVWAVDR